MPGSLLPEEGLFQKLVKRTKELSATSTEKLLQATEQAREKARPYTDKAMETAKEGASRPSRPPRGRAMRPSPTSTSRKEAAQKAYDDAMKMAKELMEKQARIAAEEQLRGCRPGGLDLTRADQPPLGPHLPLRPSKG